MSSSRLPDDGSELVVRSETSQPVAFPAEPDPSEALRQRRSDRAAARENRWVIVTRFDDGKRGYVGENSRGYGLTHMRGNAYRYATEAAARAEIPDYGYDTFTFDVEELPPKPRLKQ